MSLEVIERRERCRCGGEIDIRDRLDPAGIYRGVCYQCGQAFAVVVRQDKIKRKEIKLCPW